MDNSFQREFALCFIVGVSRGRKQKCPLALRKKLGEFKVKHPPGKQKQKLGDGCFGLLSVLSSGQTAVGLAHVSCISCFFICCNPVGPVNECKPCWLSELGGLAIPQVAAINVGVLNVWTSSFLLR